MLPNIEKLLFLIMLFWQWLKKIKWNKPGQKTSFSTSDTCALTSLQISFYKSLFGQHNKMQFF